jgi:hypothetical protein
MSEQNRRTSPTTPTTEHREGDVTLGSSIPFAREAPPNQLALLGPSTPSPAPASRQNNTPSRTLRIGADDNTLSRHSSPASIFSTPSNARQSKSPAFTPKTFTVKINHSPKDARFCASHIASATKGYDFTVEDMYLEAFWLRSSDKSASSARARNSRVVCRNWAGMVMG